MSRRGMFGWSYPPGAASDPNAPWNQEDPPCDICKRDPFDCICPECPVCGACGDPLCYDEKGNIGDCAYKSPMQPGALMRRQAE
jgi:hypothetical protein